MPPDDASGLTTILDWLRNWGWSIALTLGVPTAWRIGGYYNDLKSQQLANVKQLDDHNRDIEVLKAGRAAADLRIAELPTRSEMTSSFSRVERRLDLLLAGKEARGD